MKILNIDIGYHFVW